MIIVKKPDGTTVRMTLDEVKKMKVQKNTSKNTSPVETQNFASLQPPPAASAQPAPVAPVIARSEERTTKQSPDRSGSAINNVGSENKGIATASSRRPRNDNLLAEDMPLTVNKAAPMASSSRVDQVEKITKKVSFKVSPDNENRLRAIIQLRLKEIRTVEETRETALRKVGDGGLGLTEAQANELARLCDEEIANKNSESHEAMATIKTLKSALPASQAVVPKTKAELPATATPFNAFLHGEKTTPAGQSPSGRSLASPSQGGGNSSPAVQKEIRAPFKLDSQNTAKPTMHDIVPRSVEMGPVDEIRSATLTDFRRLSTDPVEASRRFSQKFTNLKEESILLFLDALNAWRLSSLYLDYVATLGGALADQQKITATMPDKNKIQLNEIKALIEMNKSLLS